MKIIFAGTPHFALPALAALVNSTHTIVGVFTQPDRPAGRGQHLQASPVKQFAQQHQLPLFQPKTLRHSEIQQQLHDLHADVMVVAAYGLLLPSDVLTIPRHGCINIHASLLPRWRGAAPIQRAIIAGDQETGITMMQMDMGLDTGAMLHKIACPILPADTAQTLHDRLAPLGADALFTVLSQIEQHSLQPLSQNETQATYAAKIQKSEAAINWAQPAINIERAIRAFYPFPGAHTFLDQQLIKIQQATVTENHTHAIPGTIVNIHAAGIDVATEKNILTLQRLQLAGKKSLFAAELLKSSAALFSRGKCFSHVIANT